MHWGTLKDECESEGDLPAEHNDTDSPQRNSHTALGENASVEAQNREFDEANGNYVYKLKPVDLAESFDRGIGWKNDIMSAPSYCQTGDVAYV